MRNRMKIFFALGAVIIMTALFFPIKSHWDLFWDIDSCLDRGGRFNHEAGECEFFDRLKITTVVLVGREDTSRYSLAIDVAALDALTAAELAVKHADELGYRIIGVREIKVRAKCDTCQSPQVLETYDRVFVEGSIGK
jgi:hypothetical protein